MLNFPDYVASGFNPASLAAQNIIAHGYPPDIVAGANSMWQNYSNSYWEVTACQWQKRLDPGYDTYGSGVGNYNYIHASRSTEFQARHAAISRPPARYKSR